MNLRLQFLTFATIAIACGDSNDGRPPTEPDAPVDIGVDADTFDAVPEDIAADPDVAPDGPDVPLAGFGEPCARDGECRTGFCIVTPDFDEGFCTSFCIDDEACELEGWTCVFLLDSGGDGARVCAPTELCIDADEDGYGRGPSCEGFDCDDENPELNAGADEVCNGLDDDCDGFFDENTIDAGEECVTEFPGECARGITSCELGFFDCVSIAPASQEICNGLDDDCDGETDEVDGGEPISETCYPAAPETTGVGPCTTGVRTCSGGVFSQCEGLVLPSIERCNGIDDDCDGEIDEGDPGGGFDCNSGLDGACAQGVTRCVDAEVACSEILTPDEVAESCNGLDDDCDGAIDEDEIWSTLRQGCTVGVGECTAAGVFVCDLDDPSGEPVCSAEPDEPADELCNGLDDNCDGEVDNGESWSNLGDGCIAGVGRCVAAGAFICDPDDPEGTPICSAESVEPGVEICNGLDDDCDGEVDEDEAWSTLGDICFVGDGLCRRAGVLICDADARSGAPVCSAEPSSEAAEVCNGVDDDCDGEVDEGALWTRRGVGCTEGLGECQAAGIFVCDPDAAAGPLICSAEPSAEGVEVCNGLDDDCDGDTDEGARWEDAGVGCTEGLGECVAAGVLICNPVDAAGDLVCSAIPGGESTEVCNGLDDDCDGETDEGDPWASVGAGCTEGRGECIAAGVLVCDADNPSGAPVCSAEPGPEATEVCNGLDDNCDGVVDDGALWESRGGVCFDGVGACQRAGILVCNAAAPGGPLDCTAVAGTETDEVCNGLDDDCNGEVDDLEATLCPLQLGVCAGSAQICAGGGGFLDCTTLNYGLDYELVEISCDGLDNDCDGVVDNVDIDRDGFIDVDCGGTDCDDLSPLVNPEAPEVCGDLVDNDCNDVAEDRDVDGDGFIDVACGGDDCNDASVLAGPGLDEVCGDRLDNDCDGSADNKDIDGDSFLDPACGGTDCDDNEPRAFPGNPELCDGVDNDCSDVIDDKDTDGDGFIDDDPVCGGTDCDDGNIFVRPGADEICGDLVDDDCSGALDDRDIDGDGFIDDDPACGGDDCMDSLDTVFPGAPEIRDGEDNDCNLLWDEGLVLPGELIITEAMPNPSAVADSFGEWIEVYNTSDTAINLNSFRLHDDDGDSWLVLEVESVYVGPGEYATLCRFGLFSANGGVVCDATYDDFVLANSTDEIVLSLGEVEIDRVNYDATFPWTSDTTMSLMTTALDADSNDDIANWCPTAVSAENQLPGGDYGTPRRASDCR